MNAETPTPTWLYSFANGERRSLRISPAETKDIEVVGLDPEGRVVVRYMGGYPNTKGGWLFGLTLCCNASDKGVEDGIVCRACYDDTDVGAYDPTIVTPLTAVYAVVPVTVISADGVQAGVLAGDTIEVQP